MGVTRREVLGGAALVAWLPAALATPLELRIVTTHLAPYSIEHDRAAPGALVELLEAILERAGIPARISFVPWKRAVHETNSLRRTAVFPLTRTPEREAAFRWLVELYREEFLFLTLRDGRFNWLAPQDMKQARIGILRGSAMVPVIREMGYQRVVETNSIRESMRFLEGGIVDALMGDRSIFGNAIRSLSNRPSSNTERFVFSEPVRATVTWLGGSLDIPEAEAQRLQKARTALVEDGSYARIMKKYGLTP
jgi:ABC-type amino acid transport substrate-binding protein